MKSHSERNPRSSESGVSERIKNRRSSDAFDEFTGFSPGRVNKLYVLFILFLIASSPLKADDWGLVGPKEGTSTTNSQAKTPDLPYKSGEAVKPDKESSSEKIEPKLEVVDEEKVIPELNPQYPPSIGAPDPVL